MSFSFGVFMALGKRLKESRVAAGLSQSELAARVGMTQAAIAALEKRDSKQSAKAHDLASALNVSLAWLMSGNESSSPERSSFIFSHVDAWASQTPLGEDEVELPLLTEIDFAAGVKTTRIVKSQSAKLRFGKSTLSRAKVSAESGACAFVVGNSMEPVMPDGTCVGVDMADQSIRDGEIYAIDHGGMLRVKRLYRKPGGGVKIVSQNAVEHATEEYSAQQVIDNKIRIIGRVFWWSVLR